MQWGVVGKPGHTTGYLGTSAKVNFPIAFPNKVLAITATYVHADPTDTGGFGGNVIAMRHPVKTTGVTFTTDSGTDAFYYIAIGY